MFEDIDIVALSQEKEFQDQPEEFRRKVLNDYISEVGREKDWSSVDQQQKFNIVRGLEKDFGLYKEEPAKNMLSPRNWPEVVSDYMGNVKKAVVGTYDRMARQGEEAEKLYNEAPEGTVVETPVGGVAAVPFIGPAGAMVSRDKRPMQMTPEGNFIDTKTGEYIPVSSPKPSIPEGKDTVFSAEMGEKAPKDDYWSFDIKQLPKVATEMARGLRTSDWDLKIRAEEVKYLQQKMEDVKRNGGKREDIVKAYNRIREIQVGLANDMKISEDYIKAKDQYAMTGQSIGQMLGDLPEFLKGTAPGVALSVFAPPSIVGGAAVGAVSMAGGSFVAEASRRKYLQDIFQGKAKDANDWLNREWEATKAGAATVPSALGTGALIGPAGAGIAGRVAAAGVFTGAEALHTGEVPTTGDFVRNAIVLEALRIPIHAPKYMMEAYAKRGTNPDAFTEGLTKAYAELESRPSPTLNVNGVNRPITYAPRNVGEKTHAEVEAENMVFNANQVEMVGGLGNELGPDGVPVYSMARSNEFRLQQAKDTAALVTRVRTIDAEIADLRTQELASKSKDKPAIRAQIDVLEQEKRARNGELLSIVGAEATADNLVGIIHENMGEAVGLGTIGLDAKTANRIRSGVGTKAASKPKKGDVSTGYEITLGFMGSWGETFNLFSNVGISKTELRSLFTKLYMGIENSVAKHVLTGLKGAAARHESPEMFREMLKKAGYTEAQIDIVKQSQDLRNIGRQLGFTEKELNLMMQDEKVNAEMLEGIAPQDRKAIEEIVKDLGSYDVVKATFWKDDAYSAYARKYGRQTFKVKGVDKDVPVGLQVEPGDEVTIVKDSAQGIRQYKPVDEALAFIDGKTREISESGVKELKRMFADAKESMDPSEFAKVARALREVNIALKQRGRTVNVYDDRGQKVGEKMVEETNIEPTKPEIADVGLKNEQTGAVQPSIKQEIKQATSAGYRKPKPIKAVVEEYNKAEYDRLRERVGELEGALVTFDGIRNSMTQEEWRNFVLPTDSIPAPERIKLLEKEYAELKGKKQAMKKLKPQTSTTLGFMGTSYSDKILKRWAKPLSSVVETGDMIHGTDSIESLRGILKEGLKKGFAGAQGEGYPFILVYDRKQFANLRESQHNKGDYTHGGAKGKPKAVIIEPEAFVDRKPYEVLANELDALLTEAEKKFDLTPEQLGALAYDTPRELRASIDKLIPKDADVHPKFVEEMNTHIRKVISALRRLDDTMIHGEHSAERTATDAMHIAESAGVKVYRGFRPDENPDALMVIERPKRGTTLGFMGSQEEFIKNVLPNTRQLRGWFKEVAAQYIHPNLRRAGSVGAPRLVDKITSQDIAGKGAWLLQPDGRWIYTGFNTHNMAAKEYYRSTKGIANDAVPLTEWYGDLCRDTGVMRVRFGTDMERGGMWAYVDTEGILTKQQADVLMSMQRSGQTMGTEWVLSAQGADRSQYIEGAGIPSMMQNSNRIGWYVDAKDLGLIGKGQKGFTLAFSGTGFDYEKVPGLTRKDYVHDSFKVPWKSVIDRIVSGNLRGGAVQVVSKPVGKGKWVTPWNNLEMGSYFIDREGRVFGGDELIHGEVVYAGIAEVAQERGIPMDETRGLVGEDAYDLRGAQMLDRYLIDTGHVRLNLAEGAFIMGYVKMSKQQVDALNNLKRARKPMDYFEFEFGNETTGMTTQGSKAYWEYAIKNADIVAKSEKDTNLIDRMYRWSMPKQYSVGFMGIQELNSALEKIESWARKNDRPGIALAAQLKEQFKKLMFYPDAPPNLANAIRVEMIGGINGILKKRQDRVARLTEFDGKKASDDDIKAATEIIFLKDQLTRTLADKGNPDITLQEAEGLLVNAMSNASNRAKTIAQRMREELDTNAAELVRRGKLDPDSLITDYAPHLVEDYTPEWAPIFNIPKKLGRPFRGYTKEAKGSNRTYRQDFNAVVDFLTMADHHNLLEDFQLKWADHYDIAKTFDEDMKMAIFGRDGWESQRQRRDVANQWHQKPGTILEIDGKRYVVWSPDTPFSKELYPHYENRRIMDEETGSYIRTMRGDYAKEEKFAGLMVGKTKRTYLLPEEVNSTFKHMVTPFGNSIGDYAVTVANRLTMNFKELAILANYPKFNFNNLIGDAFLLTMQHPAKMEFLSNIPESVKLAYKAIYNGDKFGQLTPQERSFMEWVNAQDILGGTIKAEFKRNITADKNSFRKFLDRVETVSDYREAVLRLANAKWLYDEMQAGRGGIAVQKYSHINTEGIEKITDQLGKIARDSAIDYQHTSRDFSRYIKNLVFPFGKWYFDATKIVWKYAKEHPFQVLIALNALPATAFVLNNRDNDTQKMEAQLPAKVREQLHVVIGRNPDGSIKTWTLQTPQDALIGTKVFTMAWNQLNYVYNKQKDIVTASRDLIKDWGIREAESVAFLMSPITRFMKGLYSGKDPWDGRPVYTADRDKMPSFDKRKEEALFLMKTMVPMLGSSISDYNDKAQPAERAMLTKISGFAGTKALGFNDYDPQAHLTVRNGKVINYDTLEKLGEYEAKDAMLIHNIKDDWVRSMQPLAEFLKSDKFQSRLNEFKSMHEGNMSTDAVASFANRVIKNTAGDPSTISAWFDNLAWQAERSGKSAEAARLRALKEKVRTYQMFLQLKRTDKTVRDMIDDVYESQSLKDFEHERRMQKLDKFMEENKIAQ